MTVSMIRSEYKGSRRKVALKAEIGLVALFLLLAPTAYPAEAGPNRQSADRAGSVASSDGLTLHLKADLGSVEIQAQPPGAPRVIQYSVHVETDASGTAGKNLLDAYTLSAAASRTGVEITGALPTRTNRAQFWVQFVISVPANYNLEIHTGAGDIQTSDIGGRALLETEGGNITTGRINCHGATVLPGDRVVAKLETQGGHIKVQDVSGDLDAQQVVNNFLTAVVS
jgi:hypothetical protein